ncbi:MAG: cytochrome c biogenesis protein CcdA [Halioglobus sp.]
MAFPYLIQGKQLLVETGHDIKTEKMMKGRTLSQFLTKLMVTKNQEEITATFAIPEYFQFMDQVQAMARHRPEKYHVFFITENIHVNRLPQQLPSVTLLRPDNTNIKPVRIEGPNDVDHHRASFVYFDKIAADGTPTLPENGDPFRLVVKNTYETGVSYVTWYEWKYPLEIPEDLASGNIFSLIAVFTLSIGLLSAVLTPCMLQLSVMYLAVLTNSSLMIQPENTGATSKGKSQVFLFSLFFILGFVILFSAVGALIGWSGQLMQAYLSLYSRPISVVAGIFVTIFGLYLAKQAGMPLLCKVPMGAVSETLNKHSLVGSALLAVGYSLGCITCFGGAIIGTLMVYVGSLQSPLHGAIIMLLFSLGIAVPFLLAALLLSRSSQALEWVSRWQKPIQYTTASLVLFFGLVLLSDNYHTLSDFLYPMLGLG